MQNLNNPPFNNKCTSILEFAADVGFYIDPKDHEYELGQLQLYIDELAERFKDVDPFPERDMGMVAEKFPEELHREIEQKIIHSILCPHDQYILRRMKDAVLYILRETLSHRQSSTQ